VPDPKKLLSKVFVLALRRLGVKWLRSAFLGFMGLSKRDFEQIIFDRWGVEGVASLEIRYFTSVGKAGEVFRPTDVRHWSLVDLGRLGKDPKLVWEPSRFEFLDDYVFGVKPDFEEGFRLILLWHKLNPFDFGENWFSNMEVAIRVLHLLRFREGAEGRLNAHQLDLLDHSIRLHEQHLKQELRSTKYSMGGNHYLIELCALQCLASSNGDASFDEALLNEIGSQFLADGGNFEGSVGYHIFTLDAVLFTIIRSKVAGVVIPDSVINKAKQALEFVVKISAFDLLPNIGDMDDGVITRLTYQSPMSVSKFLSHYTDVLEGIVSLDTKVLTDQFEVQKYFGLSTYRGGSSGYDWTLWFRHGSIEHGHSHLDMLQVLIADIEGPWLLDSGTYQYGVDNNLRNSFRCLEGHSTVSLAKFDYPKPFRPFMWSKKLPVHTKVSADSQSMEAGYGEYDEISVTRRVSVVGHTIVITDQIRSEFGFETRFLFAGVVEHGSDNCIVVKRPNCPAKLVLTHNLHDSVLSMRSRDVSSAYACKFPATELLISGAGNRSSTEVEFRIGFERTNRY